MTTAMHELRQRHCLISNALERSEGDTKRSLADDALKEDGMTSFVKRRSFGWLPICSSEFSQARHPRGSIGVTPLRGRHAQES